MTETSWPPGADPGVFFANLEILGRSCPELAERLCWPVEGDTLEEGARGEPVFRLHESRFPLAVDVTRHAAELDALEPASTVVAFGVGGGELVLELLRRGHRVVAWERDPWLLRLFLGSADVTGVLRATRLELALGVDLLELAGRGLPVVEHPLLAKVYSGERRQLAEGVRGERVVIADGGLYVESLVQSFRRQGFEPYRLDVERLSVEELRLSIERLAPKLIASINYREGLSDFAASRGVPLVTWEIDPATCDPDAPRRSTENTFLFTYRPANVAMYQRLGFTHVEYLPLAADTRLRRPLDLEQEEREHFGAPISFVGSSVAQNAAAFRDLFAELYARWPDGGAPEEGRRIHARVLERQCEELEAWRVPELLEQAAPGFSEWARAQSRVHDPAILLGEAVASEKRLRRVEALGGLGVHVWGDEGWRRTAAKGARYRGPAAHLGDVTRIFNASTINLDIGRAYQSDIATMRVFDVLACGGFALVEHSRALEDAFEVGSEVISYRNENELVEKARHYLAHPLEARAIAERGRRAVLERHDFDDRVELMLDAVEAAERTPDVARARS